ncbi:NAD-dependent epimerase/dehydratase family protein [Lutibacter aestuarii]|uniref:NAD-dependent epimerase/dehydratase family protein n=1 Tax=Lutibacter aestuarii TaxID=861111 RepID=A0ABW2Z5M0_9FLAO
MVVGNGLLAQAFSAYKDRRDVIIFASGVSNSSETKSVEFAREKKLLQKTIDQNPKSTLVYFSTTSITDSAVNNSAYVHHKLAMEAFIKSATSKYIIFRISNVVGALGNNNTILNYLVDGVKTGKQLAVWKYAERNLIDIEDVVFIISNLLEQPMENNTINIASSKALPVVAIVKEIEVYLQKKAILVFVEKGAPININTSCIQHYINTIAQNKGEGIHYLNYLLHKYYS